MMKTRSAPLTFPDGSDIFRRLIEQTRDYALFALDPGGRVFTWNLGCGADQGLSRRRNHRAAFQQVLHAGGRRARMARRRAPARRGRRPLRGRRLARPQGRIALLANVIITALRGDDNELLGFAKVTRDLTKRKEELEALRQSEERFRLLVDGVTDYAIYMLDPDGLITSWNAGAQRIKGFSADEVIGTHFSRFYLEEDRRSQPWQELALARSSGRAENEGWRLRKDGERFWARVVVTRLLDSEGKLRGFAKVTQDLSDRRQIRALEQAAKEVSSFIAVLSHELRNPLAPIRNALAVLAKRPVGDDKVRALHQVIERQSAQLVRIVDDMLDMSRISKGMLSVARKPTDLAEVVRRSLETVSPLIDAQRHTVSVEPPNEPLVVSGDIDRLTQVVGNLLNNAARYTPPGGKIRVVLSADGGTAVVRVVDNGRGIAPSAIDTIFDMFVRATSSSHDLQGGLGIGLALSRRIAELHGGTLTASSAGVGQGAEFVLRLRRDSSVAHASAAPKAEVPIARSAPQRRVMIVDDNADAASTIDQLVRILGAIRWCCTRAPGRWPPSTTTSRTSFFSTSACRGSPASTWRSGSGPAMEKKCNWSPSQAGVRKPTAKDPRRPASILTSSSQCPSSN
jgi:PAS domain S-box-containing protein